ncbi:type 1 fimbrial protein [Serratia marcescens]|nr:type 1 fimbrial protein [Serratia marcescens]AXX26430.1 type 1 fimbrial protein [Serratia marcescens]MBH2602347.1 type 1 fimbrial protein [Serratia marcescens]MBH2891308.1 type 1 fimbrial protein [Serratia marcescens]MBN5392248.1 type 1 fimbrial protein [Serratia marcescens]
MMIAFGRACRYVLGAIALSTAMLGNSVAAENMRFHGALVAEPCVIPPGKEVIQLDFGSVVDKYLYLNQRTHGIPLVIQLAECDLSLGATVTLTFTGNESIKLPGMLLPEAGSQAAGIAIGLETPEGQPLPLNRPSAAYPLRAGNSEVQLRAYVQGEPQAIAQKSITHGAFNATATFILGYE